MKRPATVIDLDGTLIAANSLKIYLMCGLRHLILKLKAKETISLLRAVVKRQTRLSPHSEMKESILRILYPYPEILPGFGRKVRARMRPVIAHLIEERKSDGHTTLLATAAPEYYVRSFWEGNLVATAFEPGTPMVECKGDEKLKRVNQWLDNHGCTLHTIVTDHYDDLPLAKSSPQAKCVLVHPGKKSLRLFRQLKPAHLLVVD